MKFFIKRYSAQVLKVAPFTGAWIEISAVDSAVRATNVAPFTGAWIEILGAYAEQGDHLVAPFTGAWIEISRRRGRR